MILEDAKTRKKDLSVAWIDYQKAYDSVPHSWIIECMDMYKIDNSIVNFMRHTMPSWRTTMTLRGEHHTIQTREINIKRGIFQGDSFSPELYCMTNNPLSVELNRTKLGYRVGKCNTSNNNLINHIFYMDDLKLYARNNRQLECLVNTVDLFSRDIQMKFGLSKCAKLTMKRGKPLNYESLTTISGETFPDLGDADFYKYLGVEENAQTGHNEVKKRVTTEYKRRVKLILRSELNGKNTITAINTFSVPVLTYSFGLICWTLEELRKLDRMTRKMMTQHRQHHPRSAVERLYLPRYMGGRGLLNIEHMCERTVAGLAEYVNHKEGRLLTVLRQHKPRGLRMRLPPATDLNENLKTKQRRQLVNQWKEKAMHGQHAKMMDKTTVDSDTSYQWLKQADLKGETEGFVCAIQDQVIKTRYYERHILKYDVNDRCRICHQHPETIHHIVSGCPELAKTQYIIRHNNIGRYIHWVLCKEHDLPHAQQWYQHEPTAVMDNDKAKILWDIPIQTDRTIKANKPDIVVTNKATNITTIIEISVPADHNLQEKTREKLAKYQDLRLEIERMWHTATIYVPVIVGATGVLLHDFREHLDKLKCDVRLRTLQKAAILGTVGIVRRVLNIN